MWAGWAAGRSFLWWMVDGGWRMPDAWETGAGLLRASSGASQESAPLLQSRSQPAPVSPAVRFRAGGSGGGVGRLAEVGIDEGWRIEWIPGSWVSHQRCAGWLGGKAEFPVV